MLYWVVRKNLEADDGQTAGLYLTKSQLIQAVRRNFGGSDEFDPLEEFQNCLQPDILEEVCMVVKLLCFLIYFKLFLMFVNVTVFYTFSCNQLHV